jgi:hypothetical protein
MSRSIDFIHNKVNRTLVHVHASGSQNVHMDHNDLINTVKPDYAVLNQYSVIVDLESDKTKFRIFYSGNENLTTSRYGVWFTQLPTGPLLPMLTTPMAKAGMSSSP